MSLLSGIAVYITATYFTNLLFWWAKWKMQNHDTDWAMAAGVKTGWFFAIK